MALPAYHVAQGDVLAITTWGQESFSQDCQVNGVGTISFPVLGEVRVADLTLGEIQAKLQDGLEQYLRRPRVSVTVRQYGALGTSVFVLGEVRAPGVYPLISSTGLMQVLAVAGGTTPGASGHITIVKSRTGECVDAGIEQATGAFPLSSEAVIEPGDVIVVDRGSQADETRRYTVLGEVPTPGIFDMPPGGNVHVLDAMRQAGLLSSNRDGLEAQGSTAIEDRLRTADLKHSMLTRGDIVVPLNFVALLRGDTSQDLLIQSGDVITVPRRNLIAVYAIGEVRIPGRQLLPTGATVLDLLNATGGVTGAAKLNDAAILRQEDGEHRSIPVDLGRLLRGTDEQSMELQEGDVLFVPTKGAPKRDVWSFLPLIAYLRYW